MISEKKIRLMTRAAMIEERNQKGIFISKKFRYIDFVIIQVVKAVLVMTAGYALFLLFLFLLFSEQIANSGSLDAVMIAIYVSAIAYILLLALTIVMTIRSCKDSYQLYREELKEYKSIMRRLDREDESTSKVFLNQSENSR